MVLFFFFFFLHLMVHALLTIVKAESWILDRVDMKSFESAEKKGRIQKYPDKCAQGLNLYHSRFLHA